MSNALVKSIPLTLSGSGADVKAIPETQEKWYAAQAGYYTAQGQAIGDSAYYGTLLVDTSLSTNYDSVGTYVDTFYNEAVGTHPGSSISIGSVATTIYQSRDSVDAFNAFWQTHSHLPVAADSNGDWFEMDSAAFLRWGTRLAELNHTHELTGNFRLATSGAFPTGYDEEFISDVFSDSLTNGGGNSYSIYRKTSTIYDQTTGTISAPTYYPLCLDSSENGDVREMENGEAGKSASLAMYHGIQNTGIGDYLLLPAGQTPTSIGESGTWVSRGVAVDTRNSTQNLQYTTILYTSQAYSSQYTRTYSKQYTGVSFADIPGTFEGTRADTFIGQRTFAANYQGQRNFAAQYDGGRTFAGNYSGNRQNNQNFEGIRQNDGTFTGERTVLYAGTYEGFPTRNVTSQFEGERTHTFAGNYVGTRQFAGERVAPRTFAGSRSYTNPTFNLYENPTGQLVAGNLYAGNRVVAGQFEGTRSYTGVRYSTTTFAGNYLGARQFEGGYSGVREFTGERTFEGQRSFEGVRQVNYAGTRPAVTVGVSQPIGFSQPADAEQFSGERTNVSFDPVNLEDYVKVSVGNFAGGRTFTGTRPVSYEGTRPIQRLGPAPIQRVVGPTNFTIQVTYYEPGTFTGNRTVGQSFAGDRDYPISVPVTNVSGPIQFGGNRTIAQNFTGTRVVQQNFEGNRNFANQFTSAFTQFGGNRSYVGNRQFEGVRGFTGPRNFAGVRSYTGERNFVGQRPFTGQYLGQRTFAGTYGGSRTYTNQYGGSRNYTNQFLGSRQKDQPFSGNVTQNFAGNRGVSYTNQYTGQYSSQYTGQFTSQYSNQYTGETIVAVQQTIETYTLYCRISEA